MRIDVKSAHLFDTWIIRLEVEQADKTCVDRVLGKNIMKSEPYPGQFYPTQVPHLFSVLFKGIRQITTKQLISQQFSEFTIIDNLHSYKKWSSEYGIKSSHSYQHLGAKFCWVLSTYLPDVSGLGSCFIPICNDKLHKSQNPHTHPLPTITEW